MCTKPIPCFRCAVSEQISKREQSDWTSAHRTRVEDSFLRALPISRTPTSLANKHLGDDAISAPLPHQGSPAYVAPTTLSFEISAGGFRGNSQLSLSPISCVFSLPFPFCVILFSFLHLGYRVAKSINLITLKGGDASPEMARTRRFSRHVEVFTSAGAELVATGLR